MISIRVSSVINMLISGFYHVNWPDRIKFILNRFDLEPLIWPSIHHFNGFDFWSCWCWNMFRTRTSLCDSTRLTWLDASFWIRRQIAKKKKIWWNGNKKKRVFEDLLTIQKNIRRISLQIFWRNLESSNMHCDILWDSIVTFKCSLS